MCDTNVKQTRAISFSLAVFVSGIGSFELRRKFAAYPVLLTLRTDNPVILEALGLFVPNRHIISIDRQDHYFADRIPYNSVGRNS